MRQMEERKGRGGREKDVYIDDSARLFLQTQGRAEQGRNERTDELTNERFLIQLRP